MISITVGVIANSGDQIIANFQKADDTDVVCRANTECGTDDSAIGSQTLMTPLETSTNYEFVVKNKDGTGTITANDYRTSLSILDVGVPV